MPPSIHPPFYHIFLSIKVLLSFIVYIRQSHMDFKAEICGHKLQHCYLLVTSLLEFYSNSLSFNSSTKKKLEIIQVNFIEQIIYEAISSKINFYFPKYFHFNDDLEMTVIPISQVVVRNSNIQQAWHTKDSNKKISH